MAIHRDGTETRAESSAMNARWKLKFRWQYVLIAIFVLLTWRLTVESQSRIYIDSVLVAAPLQSAGLDGAIASRWLGDAITSIHAVAGSHTAAQHAVGLAGSDLPDVTLPNSNLSLTTTVRYVGEFLGLQPTHVTAEFTGDTAHVTVTLRLGGMTATRATAPISALDSLVLTAAEAVVKETDPYVLGCFYQVRGDTAAALRISDYMLAKSPRPTMDLAYVLRGNVHFDAGHYDVALADYGAALRLNSKRPNAHLGVGMCRAAMRSYHRALVAYDAAYRHSEGYRPYILAQWGLSLVAAGAPADGMARYEEALREDPHDVRTTLLLAGACMAANKLDRAVQLYRDAVSMGPSCETYAALASALSSVHRTGEAETMFVKALAAPGPGRAAARVSYGDALAASGDSTAALRQYRLALTETGDRANALLALARFYAARQLGDSATSFFRQAAAADTTGDQVYEDWGGWLSAQGQSDDAVRTYALGVSRAPEDAELLCMYGMALSQANRLSEADSVLSKARELLPDTALPLGYWGYIYLAHDKWAEASRRYQEGEMLPGVDALYLANWALALNRLGQSERALAVTQRAAEIDSTHCDVFYQMGKALENLNQREDALRAFAMAESLRATCSDARDLDKSRSQLATRLRRAGN